MNYGRIVAVLVEAIKEQQQSIEELLRNIESIESSHVLKGAFSPTSSNSEFDIGLNNTKLFQNSPNPFTEETIIKYYLEDNVAAATIFIYDMSGKQLRSYKLHHRGSQDITINGGELDAGMYMYTLIANGQVIGSKQMILTEK